MIILYIVFFILVIAIIITAFTLLALNNFENYNIRVTEAETNIEATLNKRFDLLNKSNEVIKKELNTEDEVLKTVTNMRSSKLNNFELDEKLYGAMEEFYNYSDEYLELKNNDDYTKIEIDLIETEAEILALKEYYNDIAKKYNELVNKVPFNLVAKIKKYNEKQIFVINDHTELISNLKQR